MSDVMILCFDLGSECCCCGGSATLGGTQEAIPGSRPSLRYCSIECHDDWEDFLATTALRLACCQQCGFDRQEHADDCPGPSPAVLPQPSDEHVWNDPINAFKYGSPVSGVAGNPEGKGADE